jgi:hypothetical protein
VSREEPGRGPFSLYDPRAAVHRESLSDEEGDWRAFDSPTVQEVKVFHDDTVV